MLDFARGNAEAEEATAVEFIFGNVTEIDRWLAGRRFDLVVCNPAFWHFPEPEKVVRSVRDLLCETGLFGLSLATWVGGSPERREAYRAKAREVLRGHGVPAEQIATMSARGSRPRVDHAALLMKGGFSVRESFFELPVSPESREAWRQISVFSDRGRWPPQFPGLDPAVRSAVRAELDAWRHSHLPRASHPSRWRILAAQRT